MAYEPTKTGSHALHAPKWHADCPVELHHQGVGRPVLWCPACRCYVSLEAVAAKVQPLSTMDPATPIPAPVTP